MNSDPLNVFHEDGPTKAPPTLQPIAKDVQKQAEVVGKLHFTLKKAASACKELHSVLRETKEELAATHGELKATKQELSASERKASGLEEQLVETKLQLNTATAEAATERQMREELESSVQELRGAVTILEEDLIKMPVLADKDVHRNPPSFGGESPAPGFEKVNKVGHQLGPPTEGLAPTTPGQYDGEDAEASATSEQESEELSGYAEAEAKVAEKKKAAEEGGDGQPKKSLLTWDGCLAECQGEEGFGSSSLARFRQEFGMRYIDPDSSCATLF